jgi:CHAD domain-containing protein
MPGGHHYQHPVDMKWSVASSGKARGELSRVTSAQLARAREALEVGKDLASTVHEARRAIKRARALLRLADPWPRNSPTDSTLRDANRVLAVLRDGDVLVLTAEDIHDGSPSSGSNLVPRHLLEALEEERRRLFAESGSADGPLHRAGELLRSASAEGRDTRAPEAMAGPERTGSGSMGETESGSTEEMASGGTELLRLGLDASYSAVRAQSGPAAGEGPVDEQSHKLRKRVKDLRYQLEFLDTGQPKLGRLVRDLHHLTDLLGDRNDLAVLSRYTASADVLCQPERAALTAHVEGRKQALRSEAVELSARLFEEESDSFVRRIEAWVTPPQGPPQG